MTFFFLPEMAINKGSKKRAECRERVSPLLVGYYACVVAHVTYRGGEEEECLNSSDNGKN